MEKKYFNIICICCGDKSWEGFYDGDDGPYCANCAEEFDDEESGEIDDAMRGEEGK